LSFGDSTDQNYLSGSDTFDGQDEQEEEDGEYREAFDSACL
jgi:hypothetical protein